jgi:hypothetical protein
MSTVTNVKYPRPMLNVSGLKTMKHNLHCLVNTSISRICSVLISRQWSPPDLCIGILNDVDDALLWKLLVVKNVLGCILHVLLGLGSIHLVYLPVQFLKEGLKH